MEIQLPLNERFNEKCKGPWGTLGVRKTLLIETNSHAEGWGIPPDPHGTEEKET